MIIKLNVFILNASYFFLYLLFCLYSLIKYVIQLIINTSIYKENVCFFNLSKNSFCKLNNVISNIILNNVCSKTYYNFRKLNIIMPLFKEFVIALIINIMLLNNT